MHFDSFSDAMEVYGESLKETFGEFHVLVRPRSSERLRRAGYISLDGIEKIRSSEAVQSAVRSLRGSTERARQARRAVESRYEELRNPRQPQGLPETVAVEPLSPLSEPQENLLAEEATREAFSSGTAETMQSFARRVAGGEARGSFSYSPMDRKALDDNFDLLSRAQRIKDLPRVPSYKEQKKLKERLDRAKRPQRITLRKKAARGAARLSGKALRATGRGMVTAGYAVRATADVGREAASMRSQQLASRAQSTATVVKRRAALMSIPASHIRPGDTFDGTRVRAVEALGDGRVKISYQAEAGGKLLATTVDQNRSMRVDRKTRREARNSRIGLAVARPLNRVKDGSMRIAKISGEQLSLMRPIRSADLRYGSIEASIREAQRTRRQIELEGELKSLLSTRKNARELQSTR